MSSTYRPITAKLPTTKYVGVSFPNHFQLSPLGNFPLSPDKFTAHHAYIPTPTISVPCGQSREERTCDLLERAEP